MSGHTGPGAQRFQEVQDILGLVIQDLEAHRGIHFPRAPRRAFSLSRKGWNVINTHFVRFLIVHDNHIALTTSDEAAIGLDEVASGRIPKVVQ